MSYAEMPLTSLIKEINSRSGELKELRTEYEKRVKENILEKEILQTKEILRVISSSHKYYVGGTILEEIDWDKISQQVLSSVGNNTEGTSVGFNEHGIASISVYYYGGGGSRDICRNKKESDFILELRERINQYNEERKNPK